MTIVLKGWDCPNCRRFNGEEKEKRVECSSCGFKPTCEESDIEREERHLTEDLNQSIPKDYHELIRILIKRAIILEQHRCVRKALEFASSIQT